MPGWPRALLSRHVTELGRWISNPQDSLGYGARHLINVVERPDKALAQEIVDAADPAAVAAAVSAVTPETAYSLGELVAGVGQGASPEWLDVLRQNLSRERILQLAANWPKDQATFSFANFCRALSWCDDTLALDAAERFAPIAAATLAIDPLEGIVDLDAIISSVLRMFDPLGVYVGKLAPTPRQRAISRQLCASIDPATAARQISAARKRDFQRASHFLTFLKAASPRKYASIVGAFDWAAIEATIGADWKHLFHDAEVFLGVCHSAASAPVLQQVIERNLSRIDVLPPRLAYMAPAAAYLHLENGKQIGLGAHSHYEWQWTAVLLGRFGQERPDLIDRLLTPFEAQAGKVLSQKDRSWYREAALCIRALRDIAPASLHRVLSAVDCAPAETGWAASLSAKGGARHTAALLVEAALPREDAIGDVARRLRARFPRASKPTRSDLKQVHYYPESQLADTAVFEPTLANLGLSPDEGHGVFVVGSDERIDVVLELGDGGERGAGQRFTLQDGEPDLDLIEPRGAGRGEVEMHPGMALQPGVVLLVGVEVVEHDVDVLAWIGGNDPVHEIEEVGAPAAGLVNGADLAGGDLESGEQGCRSMTFVVVALAAQGPPVGQFEIALRSLQRLDRGLLIDAQDNRFVGRGDVEADDIGCLGSERRIVALAPGFTSRKIDLLRTQEAPDILHVDIAESLGQQRSGPARIALRRRTIEELEDALIRSRPVDRHLPRPRSFLKPFKPLLGKTPPPVAYDAWLDAHFLRDRAGRTALGRQQHNSRSLHVSLGRRRRTKSPFQHRPLLRLKPHFSCFGYHPNLESRLTLQRKRVLASAGIRLSTSAPACLHNRPALSPCRVVQHAEALGRLT